MIQIIFEQYLWLYDYIVNSKITGLVSILSTIPVPSFISDISSNGSAIGGQASFYMGVFRIDDGVPLILSALVIRFIIRRIPVIG